MRRVTLVWTWFLSWIAEQFRRIGTGPPARKPTLFVQNGALYDNASNKVILRGVNLPLLDDWTFPGSDRLAELERTGANAVRIQWYVHYGDPARPLYTVGQLSSFLEKCRTSRMIPIVMLSDYTCKADTTLVNTGLVPWWTSPDVVAMLNQHKRYVIVNLANELGNYRWAGSSAAALSAYKNAYKTAVTSIRNAGLTMPIMIDAPDCGTSLNAFTSIGQELVDHDPQRNVLLSVHAYWASPGFDGPSEIQKAYQAKLPIVFGEIANKQSDGNDECYYDLDGTSQGHPPDSNFTYQSLLTSLANYGIGWLAWSWGPDKCTSRRMTSDGTFARLTPYGSDIVNNGVYGLKTHAKRTPTLP